MLSGDIRDFKQQHVLSLIIVEKVLLNIQYELSDMIETRLLLLDFIGYCRN